MRATDLDGAGVEVTSSGVEVAKFDGSRRPFFNFSRFFNVF